MGVQMRNSYTSSTSLTIVRQSTSSTLLGRSPPMKPSPGAAPNTSSKTARLSGSHALKPLPYARTWLLTLHGASHFPLLARCMKLPLNAVPKLLFPPPRVDLGKL